MRRKGRVLRPKTASPEAARDQSVRENAIGRTAGDIRIYALPRFPSPAPKVEVLAQGGSKLKTGRAPAIILRKLLTPFDVKHGLHPLFREKA